MTKYTVFSLQILQNSQKTPKILDKKLEDKFTNLSKIGFSMECFTADFLKIFTKKHQKLAFGWTAYYYLSSNQVFQGFS